MVYPSLLLNFLCILLNTTQCEKYFILPIVTWSQSLTTPPLFHHNPGQVRNKRYPLQEHFYKENENCILKPHLKRLNKLWNLSPADTAHMLLLLYSYCLAKLSLEITLDFKRWWAWIKYSNVGQVYQKLHSPSPEIWAAGLPGVGITGI